MILWQVTCVALFEANTCSSHLNEYRTGGVTV